MIYAAEEDLKREYGPMVIAYRARYSFANTPEKAEKYQVFLKDHILELSPKYYGVAESQKVSTPDGIMYDVKLVEELGNPEHEIIAECFVNNSYIYLWRDKCWMVAVNTNDPKLLLEQRWVRTEPYAGMKNMVLFQIGESCTT